MSVEASRCWRLGRWDGFLIPKPFARVTVTLRAPHSVPPTLDTAALEAEQERLRELMMSQTDRARAEALGDLRRRIADRDDTELQRAAVGGRTEKFG